MEKKENLISVIIPMYNAEKTLDRCLGSILNQSYSNLEIIIVNDGSTDGSVQKVK
jgi:glycosyltransferase involved in cell wall biosynthesis